MSTTPVIHNKLIFQPQDECGSRDHFPKLLAAFIRQQCATWTQLREARAWLAKNLVKSFMLSDAEVFVQHNPHRIKSSATRVDKEFIHRRPCFLCPDRLYEEQKALVFRNNWLVLNNPFPIFRDHLVVAHTNHLPQHIFSCLHAMIAFVQDTGGSFTAFYNGPACGASAPDHLHFQACPAESIPIVMQLDKLHADTKVAHPVNGLCNRKTLVYSVAEFDRRALFFCSTTDPEVLQHQLHAVVVYLQNETASAEEPLINIIIAGSNGRLQGIIFPRKAHRPACYFSRGKSKLLVSPGAVDVGGLIVIPRREDFERITGEQILNIFSEVCYGKDIFKKL